MVQYVMYLSKVIIQTFIVCISKRFLLRFINIYLFYFQVELKGLSGPIEFKEGRRIQFKLDLLKLKQHSLVKVGEWSPTGGVNISDKAAFFDSGTMNVTLVVITILVGFLTQLFSQNDNLISKYHTLH